MKKKNGKILAILLGLALILQYSIGVGSFSVYAEEGPDGSALTKTEAEAPAPKAEEPAPKADPAPAPKEEPAPKAEEPAPKQEAEPAAPAEEAAPAADDTGAADAPEADAPADEQGDEAGDADGQVDVEATDEEAAPVDGEIPEEVAEEPAEDAEEEGFPAVTLSKTVAGVTVTLDAPKGALPEGAQLSVVQITAGKYFDAVAARLAAEGKELTDAVAFDVTPLDKDGKEIQPRRTVKVTFRNTGLDVAEGGDVDVFRVSDSAASVTEMGTSVATAGTQAFSTNHFTIYVSSVSNPSADDPNGDGSGNANDNGEHSYVMEYGDGGNTVTLSSDEYGEKKDNWSLSQSGNYCSFNTNTKVLTYVNTTQADTVVTVVHEYKQKSGKSKFEYFYITLKPQTFTVTFKVKGVGSTGFGDYTEIPVPTGGSIADSNIPTLPDEPGSDGRTYKFDGWYSDESCSSDASFSNIRSSFAVYGRYVPLAKITFKKNISDDASIPDPIEAGEGTSVTLGSASTADKTFNGWNTAANGGGTSYSAGQPLSMPEGGMTLYAQWKDKTDQVTFTYYQNHKNNDYETVNVEEKTSGLRSEIWDGIPSRDGHIFLGWSKVKKNGSVDYNPGQSIIPEADLNLYAVWGTITKEHLDYDTPLTANGKEVPYNGSEYSVSGIVEGEASQQYTGLVKVGHYYGHNANQETDIYVDVSAINAKGTNAGQYAMPVAAEIYTKKVKDSKPPKATGEYVDITKNLLTIRPAKITVVTDDATRGYIQGEPLTAGGTLSCEGCSDSTITHGGGTATLCAGETLNIRTTGSQEEIGWTYNTYEVDWGTPDGWGSGKSTASKYNYNIVEETLGKLEVVGKVKISFVDEDGSTVIEDQEYDYGTKAEDVTPPTATKAEDDDYTYAFDTWQPEIADVEEEATYTAVYKKVKARITFDLDGGKLNGDAGPITQKYTIGETIKVLDAPVKDGYDFVEWQGSSYQPGDDYEVTEAHTFTAVWKESPSQGGGSDAGNGTGNVTTGRTNRTAAAAAATNAPAAADATVPDEAVPAAGGEDEPETIIPEDEVPKADEVPEEGDWSLANVILCAATVIGSLLALRRRKEDEDGDDDDASKARTAKIAGLVIAAASVIAFFLTNDFGGAMAMADKWSVLMAGLLGGQAVSAALTNKFTK